MLASVCVCVCARAGLPTGWDPSAPIKPTNLSNQSYHHQPTTPTTHPTQHQQVTLGILAALGMGPLPATVGSPTATAKVDEAALAKGAASSKVGHEHDEEQERVLVA